MAVLAAEALAKEAHARPGLGDEPIEQGGLRLSTLMLALLLATAATPAPAPSPPGGEARLSLDVRDVEARDAVAALVEAAGRQSVVDPDVSCRLTLRLKDVSWRQALEQVLRACRLGVDEDGEVLRVATLARLGQEQRERRALADEQARSRKSDWTALRLSYARAAELAPLLQRLLPPGSQVTYDSRTNTLLIQAAGDGR